MRPHYTQQNKQQYMRICQEYNKALANIKEHPTNFVVVSIQLHAAKGLVPQKWGRPGFVASMGSTA